MTSLRVSLHDGVARMVLSAPPLNVLTRAMLGRMRTELSRLAVERSVRVLLISAEGKHFSAGADVGEHLPPEYEEMIPEFMETVASIYGFPLPVVVAVQGRCLGGAFELVQATDMVMAAEGASFGQPEIRLGVVPPAACVLLPKLCSSSVAAELVLTGDVIGAADAVRFGLVGRVVPDAELEASASALASRIACHSGAALRAGKRMLRDDSAGQIDASLANAGRVYVAELMKTHDAVEGLRAFLDKREPSWSHQ